MREKIAEGYRIPWWAHRDDVHGRGSSSFALFPKHIGSVDPDALKIPRPKGGYYSLTESAPAPFHAEPEHRHSPTHLQAAIRYLFEPPAALMQPRPSIVLEQRGSRLYDTHGVRRTRRSTPLTPLEPVH